MYSCCDKRVSKINVDNEPYLLSVSINTALAFTAWVLKYQGQYVCRQPLCLCVCAGVCILVSLNISFKVQIPTLHFKHAFCILLLYSWWHFYFLLSPLEKNSPASLWFFFSLPLLCHHLVVVVEHLRCNHQQMWSLCAFCLCILLWPLLVSEQFFLRWSISLGPCAALSLLYDKQPMHWRWGSLLLGE